MRGNVFVPLHKVGLASHICHGNFGEVWPVGLPPRLLTALSRWLIDEHALDVLPSSHFRQSLRSEMNVPFYW
jgi:hypothetical protein